MLIHASFGSPKQSAALVFVLAQAFGSACIDPDQRVLIRINVYGFRSSVRLRLLRVVCTISGTSGFVVWFLSTRLESCSRAHWFVSLCKIMCLAASNCIVPPRFLRPDMSSCLRIQSTLDTPTVFRWPMTVLVCRCAGDLACWMRPRFARTWHHVGRPLVLFL